MPHWTPGGPRFGPGPIPLCCGCNSVHVTQLRVPWIASHVKFSSRDSQICCGLDQSLKPWASQHLSEVGLVLGLSSVHEPDAAIKPGLNQILKRWPLKDGCALTAFKKMHVLAALKKHFRLLFKKHGWRIQWSLLALIFLFCDYHSFSLHFPLYYWKGIKIFQKSAATQGWHWCKSAPGWISSSHHADQISNIDGQYLIISDKSSISKLQALKAEQECLTHIYF